MKVEVLIENTSLNSNFVCEHGLSLLIKTNQNTILFDTGQTDNFVKNSIALNEDLSKVDFAVISHGHYDHGGGLKYFLNLNSKAKVYLMDNSFEPHYSEHLDGIKYIGLDKAVYNSQIVLLSGDYAITDNVETMCHVKNIYPTPVTNKSLFMDSLGKVNDNFTHEQNLVIKDDDNKYVLIAGCAHNGIKNIIEHFYAKYKVYPKAVVGGFHLASRTGVGETEEYLNSLANYLLSTKAMFYTCHCTGLDAYEKLKQIMKDKIEYISSGSNVEV